MEDLLLIGVLVSDSIPREFQVRGMRREAEEVLSIELTPCAGTLPEISPGSHIDLHLGNGLVRSYSLMNSPQERDSYRIGVFRDPGSEGGSKYIHDHLRVGQLLRIDPPRNNFALHEGGEHSVFFAGGIGVTPFIAMAAALNARGHAWTLYYSCRNRSRAAFMDTLQRLAVDGGGRVEFHFDDEADGRLLDIRGIVGAVGPDDHLYCCGPSGMLAAYRDICANLPPDRVHFEYFASDAGLASEGGFDVVLAKSGRRINIPPGNTILEALGAAGVTVPYSCQQGICGACEVKVLSGVPDHRDMILSDAERASNETMLICCSGALSDELVIDL
ncbi:PDR/VanB family oxidoreductase [Sphingomonas sp. MG17]|uniref:PDR/VanB family oxidoreductase n=1 Tax=Sphingomonas tagetis TaxID=2949092 RepID=A0A9X2HJQ3_9SPHN|nr:PDR/VanB family oxidoreductase [Sphingomonas tagetis]MCP3732128.1 PDR/VanB family oxidoreductase [Sphingomonas tagetis]